MNWSRQVRHVAAKDMRQWRLVYAVYVLVVFIATLHGMGMFREVDVFDAAPVFVIAAGMLLVGVIVQGDSATRADAFWASRPLSPSAVATAKVAQALLIILVAIIGQSIAMSGRGIPGALIPRYLPLCFGLLGLWIVAALATAAMTKDVQTAIVAFLGTGIAFGLTMAIVERTPSISGTPRLLVGVGEGVLGLVTLYSLYHARQRARWMVAGCCLASVGPMLMLMPSHTEVDVSRSASKPILHIERADSLPFDRHHVPIRIWADGVTSSTHATLTDGYVTLTLNDGQTVRVMEAMFVPLARGDSVRTAVPLRWLGRDGLPSVHASAMLSLTDDEQRLAARGVRAMTIEGILVVNEARLAGRLDLRPGAKLTLRNLSARVEKAEVVGNDIRAQVYVSSPESPRAFAASDPYMLNTPYFALVNEARAEALTINGSVRSASNGWLVTPGVTVSDFEHFLSLRGQPMRSDSFMVSLSPDGVARNRIPPIPSRVTYNIPSPVDSEWLRGASLVMLAWEFVSRDRVHGTLTLP